jgi:hypothetical protein
LGKSSVLNCDGRWAVLLRGRAEVRGAINMISGAIEGTCH